MKRKILIVLGIILLVVALEAMAYFYVDETNNIHSNSGPDAIDLPKAPEEIGVYAINGKDFYLYEESNGREEEYRGMKLLEYDNTNSNYAELYYVLYDYGTEPSLCYTLEITDESNNNLLIEGSEEQIVGGVVSVAKIKRTSLEQKLVITVTENDSYANTVLNQAKETINLSTDLEKKVKIDQSTNLVNGFIGEICFKYIESSDAYFGTTSHAYSTALVGEYASLPIKVQYGNRLVGQEHIDISCYRNVNHLTLDEAFEDLTLIEENLGQYGLSDTYGMDIYDSNGDFASTVIINFDDMINLCKGLSIEKDGKSYTKDDFDGYAEVHMVKDENVKIGSGINAIKYHYSEGDNGDYYMFVYNDNIYEINVPTNERIQDEVQEFLDSVTIETEIQ